MIRVRWTPSNILYHTIYMCILMVTNERQWQQQRQWERPREWPQADVGTKCQLTLAQTSAPNIGRCRHQTSADVGNKHQPTSAPNISRRRHQMSADVGPN